MQPLDNFFDPFNLLISALTDTTKMIPDPFLTHYLVKVGLNYQKSVWFNVIEQITNFPVIYDCPYLFHVYRLKNWG